MNYTPLRITLFLFIGAIASSLQAAELATAKVLSMQGNATVERPSTGTMPLAAGEILYEGDTVATGSGAIVQLVFSNGSELKIVADSSITLTEVEQQSFSSGKSYEQLQADPSQSKTLVDLNYGKISGHVKKLQSGSSFDIQTPLGTAAIRGTVYEVEVRYDSVTNTISLIVKNITGTVNLVKGDKTEGVPPGKTVFVKLSKDDPNYDRIIKALENYPPFKSGTRRPPIFRELPSPVITPDDPGVIIISPETATPPAVT